MKKQVTLTALAVLTAMSASSAFAGGMTVAEKDDAKLKLSGKAFLGFTQEDNNGAKTIGGNVDRFYLQAEYTKGIWKARITTDVNNETGNTTPGLKRNMNVFLKYAFLEGNFSDAAQLRLGLSHTPWIDYEQGLWGHRYVAKVTSDHFGFDDSADYGVGLKGKIADGMANYWVTATNGGGYGKPNKTASLDTNVRVSLAPIEGLDISLQSRSGYRGKKANSTTVLAATVDKQTLTQVMVSYGTKAFRVGANSLTVKNAKTVAGDDNTATALWATGKFGDNMGAFAKVEGMKHTGTIKNGDKVDHTVVGVDFFVEKGVTLAAAYDTQKTTTSGVATTHKKMGLYSIVKF